jgi:cystathionine gamma-synthase
MPDTPERSLATRCVHAGEAADAHGSPHTPVYATSTFAFPSTAAILDVVEGRAAGSLYTRYGLNPSIQALEAKLAAIEGAEAALAFASGMAAEAALFLAHGRSGIVCIGDAYGGTLELLADQLPLLGIRTRLLLGSELERLDGLLADGFGLVFLETPTNPALEVFDIAAIATRAHAHGALLAVDNTFASPVNQQPLALGADLVVHSATKYLGGHSDLTAGALMGPAELIAVVANWRKNLGSVLAPETAALLARSLRTLPVRVQAQNASALAIARAMATHPRVARVLHPGLPSCPGHALAARQMTGFGGMLTLEITAGDAEPAAAAAAVVDRLRLFTLAPSLGGVESLVTQPCTTTHHGLSPAERQRRGIGDAMIRLSIGLEDPAELIADLEQALAGAAGCLAVEKATGPR